MGAYANEQVSVKIEFLVPETQLTQHMFYGLNMDTFKKRINELKTTQSMDVSSWTNTSIKGRINVDENNTLFLSIPYDNGWSAKVDGEAVQLKKLGGFIGFDLQKGEHTIELSYVPRGLIIGSIISIVGIMSVVCLAFIMRKQREKHWLIKGAVR